LSAGQGVQSGGKDETRGKPNKNPLVAMPLFNPFVPGQAKSRAPTNRQVHKLVPARIRHD
jgi:hypothetical protein